ncbi:MAG: phage head-tail connector protein [Sphingomonadales bacterium]|nr:phage head-tail connector protein [Sphingomonadales bacterium]
MTITSPDDMPVNLNEARSWLRLGASADDSIVAQLIRAATNICEAFIGLRLIVRAVEEEVPLERGVARPGTRPVIAVDGVTLLSAEGEVALPEDGYRVAIARDGTARIMIANGGVDGGAAERARIAFRAGMATDAAGVPEAIRQGIVRMTQHLHEARDGGGTAPPAAIAALWQPWRRLTLGGLP